MTKMNNFPLSNQNGVIAKLLDHKAALRDAINQICLLVRKQEFTQSLIELGLLDGSSCLPSSNLKVADHENNLNQGPNDKETMYLDRKQYYDYKSIKVSVPRTSFAALLNLSLSS